MTDIVHTIGVHALNGYPQAVLWAIVLGGLMCLIEVYRSHPIVSLRACLNLAVFIYLAVFTGCNCVITILVFSAIGRIPALGNTGFLAPLFAASIATFGFELLHGQVRVKRLSSILRINEQLRRKALTYTRTRQIRINARRLSRSLDLDLGPFMRELRSKRPDLAVFIDAIANERTQQAFLLASERMDLGDGILPPVARLVRRSWPVVVFLLMLSLTYYYSILATDLQVWILQKTKVSGYYRNVEARKVIANLAAKLKARAVIEVEANCMIDSFEATNNPIEVAMDRICTICDCGWNIEPGTPPTVWVYSHNNLSQPNSIPGPANP